jgi:uncharacterized delta-60 repeat protein
MRFTTAGRAIVVLKPAHVLLALVIASVATSAAGQSLDAFNPLPSAAPTTLAIQADGRILLGGFFQDASSTLIGIERLNVDGSLDSNFADPGVNDEIKAIAVQADGKILIGGNFDAIGASAHHYLARLNANGSVDASFADANLDAAVWAIALQPDGKVLVAGDFQNAGATARSYAARFTATGTLDAGFADPKICCGPARAVAVQGNGSILVGGYFLGVVGHSSIGAIVRFNTSGVLDTTFPMDAPATTVNSIVVAPDGSIFVGASYNTSDQQTQRPVAKLSANGTLDTAYADIHTDGGTNTLALQPNGKMVFGGLFEQVDGVPRHALARLNASGTLDTGFADLQFSFNAADPNGFVFGVAAQANGKTVVAGNFAVADGLSRQFAARVVTNDVVSSKLTGQASGANVIATWTRSGGGPELAQAPILMHSSDGMNFTAVGTMARVANGWQLTAAYNVGGAPFYLQASAVSSSGAGNGSSSRTISPLYVSDRLFADGFE